MSFDPVSAPFVALLAKLVESHCGLHYADRDLDLFAERVQGRATEAGFDSLLDYYYLLRYDDSTQEELRRLVDALVVNETYFFRELPALEVVVTLLRERVATGERARVWSAACATGEEPITLAILLEQAGIRDSVDIVASDISERSLGRARRGEYGTRAHRAVPDGMEPWIRVAEGRASVAARVRAGIDWRRVNLADGGSVEALGAFDVVLCRNVLIYFSDETVRRVTDNLAMALRDGGRLVVGTSESLLRFGTVFECEERGGTFVYRRSRT